jgi:hypothetical protein
MPQPEELPERLHAITRRNALELSDVRWRYDVGRLESTLAQLLRGQTGVHEVVTEREPRTPSVAQTVIEVLVVAAAAGALGGLLSRLVDPSSPDEAGRVVKTIAQQALTWVPVGAALAIWFSVWRGERRSTVARAGTGLVAGALAGAVGGAIYSVGVYLPGDYSDATTRSFRLLAVTAIGAVVGVFVGRLWSPSGWRGAAGLLAGAGGGALAQAIVNSSFRGDGTWHSVFAVGFRSFVIVGLVIGTLLALDALEGGAPLERPG